MSPLNLNRWMLMYVVIMGANFFGASLISHGPQSVPAVTWSTLLAALLLTPVGLLFVIGIQAVNPRSAPRWRYPSWSVNPFTMKEPLLFFHFAAYVSIAGGVGSIAYVLIHDVPTSPGAFLEIVIGIGLLAGVRLCSIIFRQKMARDLQL